MKLNELKLGNVLEFANKQRGLFIGDCIILQDSVISIERYDENLIRMDEDESGFDVVAVYVTRDVHEKSPYFWKYLELPVWKRNKSMYSYTCTGNVMYASFDYGDVEAWTEEDARILAEKEIVANLDKCNEALKPLGMDISINLENIEISCK